MGSSFARAVAVLVLLGSGLGCTDTPTPTENMGCLNVDGAYSGVFGDPRCTPPAAPKGVAVTQTGCVFNAVLPGYALLDGQVDGDRLLLAVTLLASSGPCGNTHLSGTGKVTYEGGRTVLSGTYGTTAMPVPPCPCLPGPGEANLTLRQ